jgi:hypothetical protein
MSKSPNTVCFVLWIESEPVLDERSQAEIRAAIGRLAPPEEAG